MRKRRIVVDRRLITRVWVLLCLTVWVGSTIAQSTRHTVADGETMYGIARRYGLPIDVLAKANDIDDPSRLASGRELVIPNYHTVQPGETLYGLAQRFGSTVDELRNLNAMRATEVLVVGRQLLLPTVQAASTPAKPTAAMLGPTDVPIVERTPSEPAVDGTSTTDSTTEADAAGLPIASRNATSVATPDSGTAAPTAESPPDATSGQGTMLATRQLPGESNVTWPHPGDRFQIEGKFPGIAIRGQAGDLVRAVADGRVIYSGPHTTLGRVVFVQAEDGYVFIYGGNERVEIGYGALVNSGDVIGRLGITPGINLPQVYFGVWRHDRYVDPAIAPRG